MKRITVFAAVLFLLLSMFTGCTEKESPPSDIFPEQSNQAFTQQDMDNAVGKNVTISSLCEKYGEHERLCGIVHHDGGEKYIEISFDSISYCLKEQENNRFSFGNTKAGEFDIDVSDHGIPADVFSMTVSADVGTDIIRGISVGDTEEKVRRSFLDCSQKYELLEIENRIYGIEDYIENQDNGHFEMAGGFNAKGNGCGYITYIYVVGDELDFRVWNDYGMLRFTITDGIVSEIYLGYFNDDIT